MCMLAVCAIIFTGCKKESPSEQPTLPNFIKGIELPLLTEVFSTGDPVTIKGSGFTKSDVIAFRAGAKSASDVKATVTEVTESYIKFSTPAGLTAGKSSIILKRDGLEQVIGSISTEGELADAKLYSLFEVYDSQTGANMTQTVSEVSKATGKTTTLSTIKNEDILYSDVTIGKVIYGSSENIFEIQSFNIESKVSKKFSIDNASDNENDDFYLVVINQKLHALVQIGDNLKLIEINTTTGAQTTVIDFGSLKGLYKGTEFYIDNLIYSGKTNSIISFISVDNEPHLMSMNLTTKTVVVGDKIISNNEYASYSLLEISGDIYIIQSSSHYSSEINIETIGIYMGDIENGKLGEKIKEFTSDTYRRILYDKKDDLLYIYSNSYFDTYSFTTSESKHINCDKELGDLVLIR